MTTNVFTEKNHSKNLSQIESKNTKPSEKYGNLNV